MASFKARIGWKRPRKKENNYCRTVSFLPNVIENSKKKTKIQKNQKIPLWLHFMPPQVDGGCERK